MEKFSELIRSSLGVRIYGCLASCYIMLRYRTRFLQVKQRRARLVREWLTVTDRGLLHMHGFSAKVPRRVTLTDEWPDDFRKVGMVTLTLLSRVTEGWKFVVSSWNRHNVGWHDGTPRDGAPPAHRDS